MSAPTTTIETVLAAIAGRQHGLVTRAQLLGVGVTRHQIQQRRGRGALLPVHRGVYRVGHRAPSVEATYLAAVFACGEEARLSGSAAAHLLGLLKGPVPPPEVTTPLKRRVAGVMVRRGRIDPPDRSLHRGIPITAVPRTLTDLAADLPLDALARACHEAGVRYSTTPAHVAAVLARRPKTPGAAKLRLVLRGDARVTLSALERRFLELLREHGLPAAGDEPPGRRAPRRLPVAGTAAHRRARQLSLPPLAPRLGAGPPPRARGTRPRRRPSALYLGRRLRGARSDAGGAPPPPRVRVGWAVAHNRSGILACTQDAPSRTRTQDP